MIGLTRNRLEVLVSMGSRGSERVKCTRGRVRVDAVPIQAGPAGRVCCIPIELGDPFISQGSEVLFTNGGTLVRGAVLSMAVLRSDQL
jgi:hypothetical protein